MGISGEETAAENDFATYDTDQSGSISDEEFRAAIAAEDVSGIYGRWDADQNDELTEEEFAEGMWASFDADASGSLTADEAELLNDAMRSGSEVQQ